MKLLSSRITWSLLLIFGGVIFLLENLNILRISNVFWAILFGLGAAAFLSTFFSDRAHWWALIPGMILLALGLVIVLDWIFPETSENWTGSVFLAGVGLSFFAVYLVSRENWWAIIPGGVMLSLAVVAALESLLSLETSGIFFMGLGLTFALVAVLPTGAGPMRWAFIPAVALVLIGLLIYTAAANLIDYVWPAALILGGIYLLYRAILPRRGDKNLT